MLRRTPPDTRISTDDNAQEESAHLRTESVSFPSGKLAAVTRKKNELLTLIQQTPPPRKEDVWKQYSIYCGKVDILHAECEHVENSCLSNDENKEKILQW